MAEIIFYTNPMSRGRIVRWMLEELRVSLFAQELKASMPVSVQRLQKQWEQVLPGR